MKKVYWIVLILLVAALFTKGCSDRIYSRELSSEMTTGEYIKAVEDDITCRYESEELAERVRTLRRQLEDLGCYKPDIGELYQDECSELKERYSQAILLWKNLDCTKDYLDP